MCAALAAIALAACGGRKGETDRASSTARDAAIRPSIPRSPLAEPAVVLPREMSFTLLEPGDGARARMRYRLDGAEQRELVVRSTVKTHNNVDGVWGDEVTLAPVRDGFGVSATAGVVQLRGLEAHVGDGTAAARSAAENYVERWRRFLQKRRIDVKVDIRGRLESVSLLDDPSGVHTDARDELTQRWLGMAVPLPEEPVAVGGTWKVVIALRAGNIVVKQTTTYRLVAIVADEWTIEIELVRIGEPQDVAAPGIGSDARVELIALKQVMKGSVIVGRGDPVPLRGRVSVELSAHVRAQLGASTTEQYGEETATLELSGE